MKIVSIKQNGKEWREWRGLGLGASDAPVIMGESPYQTPFELWLDKTGIRKRPEPNAFQAAAMQRGIRLEPVAREMLEKKLGIKFENLCAEHKEYDFMRVSFDGINLDKRILIEIKCPGKEPHKDALNGKVPKYYYSQVQQQLLIAKEHVDKALYVSWDGESKDLAIVEVPHNDKHQERLTENVIDMWKRIQMRILPDITQNDVIRLVEGVEKDLLSAQKAIEVFKLLAKR